MYPRVAAGTVRISPAGRRSSSSQPELRRRRTRLSTIQASAPAFGVTFASYQRQFGEQHLVMGHERLALEEEVVVLRIVAGPFVVLPREALERLHRLPMSDQEEVRDLALHAPEHVDAMVAGRVRVTGDAGPQEVLVI